jgi:hypothetical protein
MLKLGEALNRAIVLWDRDRRSSAKSSSSVGWAFSVSSRRIRNSVASSERASRRPIRWRKPSPLVPSWSIPIRRGLHCVRRQLRREIASKFRCAFRRPHEHPTHLLNVPRSRPGAANLACLAGDARAHRPTEKLFRIFSSARPPVRAGPHSRPCAFARPRARGGPGTSVGTGAPRSGLSSADRPGPAAPALGAC